MTEAEWLRCTDPHEMLAHVCGRASDRKLRLFACARCRRVWAQLTDEPSRLAIEVAERFADGLASAAELQRARLAANEACTRHGACADQAYADWVRAHNNRWAPHLGLDTVGAEEQVREAEFAWCLARAVAWATGETLHLDPETTVAFRGPDPQRRPPSHFGAPPPHPFRDEPPALLRDVFGNPFRPLSVDAGWLTADVLGVARAIYAEGSFRDLPILADGLEEAGCSDEAVLRHCRGPGLHVRGCFVLDALLRKS